MELENQNMLVAGKKSVVKYSGNTLHNTTNTISSTVKKAHSIFHQEYPHTNKNQYSKGVAVPDISEEMKIMVGDVVLKNLFTTPSLKCFLII